MRKIILLLLFSTQLLWGQESKTIDYLFTNVNILTMNNDKVLENQFVYINEGIIIDIANKKSGTIKARQTIDLKGKFIMPSLSDAHVHLPKKESEMEKFLILNLINGVTSLRSMRGKWDHLAWRKKYNTTTSIYPKLYLSAPPFSKNHDQTREELIDFMEKAKAFDFIKILSVKDQVLFEALDSLCTIHNMDIGGHFPHNISDSNLFKSNYTSFEHLGGLIGAPESFESRLKEIKMNNIFICPTLSWYSVGSGRYSYEELRERNGMEYISKTVMDNWIEKTKQYRNKIGKEAYEKEVKDELKMLEHKFEVIKKMKKEGIHMLLSPDCSAKYMITGFGMIDEMKLLKNAQLSNFEIFEMATVNFARFFKANNGTIEKGKDADFIILESNPLKDLETLKTIQGLFFNGNYLDKKALNKLSNSILPN